MGGGAGGLELVTRLGDKLGKRGQAQVVLVDRSPTHIWKPLLHEVAAGSMDPNTHQLEYVAQARWHHFEFQQGELTGVDRARKVIQVAACVDLDGTELLPRANSPMTRWSWPSAASRTSSTCPARPSMRLRSIPSSRPSASAAS
ncbi:NADH dehydrogenase [compost metagenome]